MTRGSLRMEAVLNRRCVSLRDDPSVAHLVQCSYSLPLVHYGKKLGLRLKDNTVAIAVDGRLCFCSKKKHGLLNYLYFWCVLLFPKYR